MKNIHIMLIVGFVCATVGIALGQYVMIGCFIGFPLIIISLGLLLIAGLFTHTEGEVSIWRRLGGMSLYVLGILLLLVVTGYGGSMAFNYTMSSRPAWSAPLLWQWVVLMLFSISSTTLIATGLRCKSNWSWYESFTWGAVALSVVPATLILFWILTPFLPLTA